MTSASLENPNKDELAESDSVNSEPAEDDRTLITELRLVIECDDWEGALAFYRDALGLRQIQGYQGDTDAQLILDVGRASIELVHPELPAVNADATTELSSPPLPQTRLAFRTSRAQAVVERLEAAGANRVPGPMLNSASTINVRLIAPDKLPISIFRPLGETEFAEAVD